MFICVWYVVILCPACCYSHVGIRLPVESYGDHSFVLFIPNFEKKIQVQYMNKYFESSLFGLKTSKYTHIAFTFPLTDEHFIPKKVVEGKLSCPVLNNITVPEFEEHSMRDICNKICVSVLIRSTYGISVPAVNCLQRQLCRTQRSPVRFPGTP
jgi:hypothetical protein